MHVPNLELKNVVKEKFDCKTFCSFGSNDSRGVAIMIFNNFEYQVEKFYKDRDGRLIYVDITSHVGKLRLVSVYCPNNIQERKIFLENMEYHINGIRPLIIGGDWNCIENLRLDKEGGNPNKGSFTWESETRDIRTRIDRGYISKSFIDKLKDVEKITSTVTDGVLLSFKQHPFNNFKSDKSAWKMNTEILKD